MYFRSYADQVSMYGNECKAFLAQSYKTVTFTKVQRDVFINISNLIKTYFLTAYDKISFSLLYSFHAHHRIETMRLTVIKNWYKSKMKSKGRICSLKCFLNCFTQHFQWILLRFREFQSKYYIQTPNGVQILYRIFFVVVQLYNKT